MGSAAEGVFGAGVRKYVVVTRAVSRVGRVPGAEPQCCGCVVARRSSIVLEEASSSVELRVGMRSSPVSAASTALTGGGGVVAHPAACHLRSSPQASNAWSARSRDARRSASAQRWRPPAAEPPSREKSRTGRQWLRGTARRADAHSQRTEQFRRAGRDREASTARRATAPGSDGAPHGDRS